MRNSARSLVRRVRAKVRHAIARTALGLPTHVQVRLSGGKPVVVDGLTLNAELQMMFALRKLVRTKSLTEGTAEECRRRVRRDALEHQGELVHVGHVRDLEIAGDVGPLRARHYAPREERARDGRRASPSPLIVYFHGGGFVVGDLDTTDNVCRLLCRHAGVHVLSIDYRLAPEHPFPAAYDDARAAFLWATKNAPSLGADPERIGVAGDSAGAQLSAALSLALARERGAGADVRVPTVQVLLYPAICRVTARPSIDLFANGFLLEKTDIGRFQAWYTPMGAESDGSNDIRCAPLHALRTPEGLTGLPPAIVATAGFDPLRDEGEEYAALLEGAGNVAVLRRFDDLTHGFANFVGVSRAARDALIEIAGTTRALFESAVKRPDPHEAASDRAQTTGLA